MNENYTDKEEQINAWIEIHGVYQKMLVRVRECWTEPPFSGLLHVRLVDNPSVSLYIQEEDVIRDPAGANPDAPFLSFLPFRYILAGCQVAYEIYHAPDCFLGVWELGDVTEKLVAAKHWHRRHLGASPRMEDLALFRRTHVVLSRWGARMPGFSAFQQSWEALKKENALVLETR